MLTKKASGTNDQLTVKLGVKQSKKMQWAKQRMRERLNDMDPSSNVRHEQAGDVTE